MADGADLLAVEPHAGVAVDGQAGQGAVVDQVDHAAVTEPHAKAGAVAIDHGAAVDAAGPGDKAAIGREVVDAVLKARSAQDQLAINDEAVTAAEEMVKLARDRQASQLGVVLEYLLAREELTRARQGRVKSVTDYNKAQHALKRAVGR